MMACACRTLFAAAPLGRMRHAASETLARHCHDHPFVTLVLSGGYLEAGDEGRRRVGAGDILVHRPFESHLDRFDAKGAEVLILPARLSPGEPGLVAAVSADPDAIARLAERDFEAASRRLFADARPQPRACEDWPDRLASDLRGLQAVCIRTWADQAGLRAETVSRGFRQAYGTSPKAFRATARARAALGVIRSQRATLSSIAVDLGFADQAHMTRAIVALTGCSPRAWRPVGQIARHKPQRLGRASANGSEEDGAC